MTVPQWVYDHHSGVGKAPLPVAVLVPRRAIAEGLSKHVSELRGSQLGEKAGLGIGGTVVWTAASRIVFMTYGFFMGITISDPYFSRCRHAILNNYAVCALESVLCSEQSRHVPDETLLKAPCKCSVFLERPCMQFVCIHLSFPPWSGGGTQPILEGNTTHGKSVTAMGIEPLTSCRTDILHVKRCVVSKATPACNDCWTPAQACHPIEQLQSEQPVFTAATLSSKFVYYTA